jgi:hypothetical protein
MSRLALNNGRRMRSVSTLHGIQPSGADLINVFVFDD